MSVTKLIPACKNYLWGGERLYRYGKSRACSPLAETWELSVHPDGVSQTEDGTPLTELLTPAVCGTGCPTPPDFPMLVKLIDAQKPLSVQVHPDDGYARAHEGGLGKSEAWYIVEAAEGAGIYLGFSRDVTREEFERAIGDNTLTDLMNFVPVQPGDCYFIPAGTLHAIGAGCLVCEVQQSSNLTYRVFDYGRLDANGRPRPLHIAQALAVTDLQRFEPRRLALAVGGGERLALHRCFTLTRYTVRGELLLAGDPATLRSFTCVAGQGSAAQSGAGEKAVPQTDPDEKAAVTQTDPDEKTAVTQTDSAEKISVRAGDTLLLPAGEPVSFAGDMTLLCAEVRRYFVGIDLGGTFIKGGVADDLGNLLVSDKTPTGAEGGADAVARNIAALATGLLSSVGLSPADAAGLGIGVPGMIDSEAGTVVYSNNLRWENFPIAQKVAALTGIPVRIANDANVAALGEARFGSGASYRSTVLLTLGTGVGGGVVLDGRLFEGNRSAGAELGHSVIVAGGEPCTCGRRGCLEAYASATALIRETRRAMREHPESAMWEIGSTDRADGATAFRYADRDETARRVVDRYIDMLGVGLCNIANEFRPEAILLGGGICAEGERLIAPLQKIVDRDRFGGERGPAVRVATAALGNRAGILGAAALFL